VNKMSDKLQQQFNHIEALLHHKQISCQTRIAGEVITINLQFCGVTADRNNAAGVVAWTPITAPTWADACDSEDNDMSASAAILMDVDSTAVETLLPLPISPRHCT
jgi:hypothetical protein